MNLKSRRLLIYEWDTKRGQTITLGLLPSALNLGICAYCQRNVKLTREHLFPESLARRTPTYNTYIDHSRPKKPLGSGASYQGRLFCRTNIGSHTYMYALKAELRSAFRSNRAAIRRCE
jgi:hypothetical protein